MKHLKKFENFDDRGLGTGMDHPGSLNGWESANNKTCKWCDKEFAPKNKDQYCCCSYCDSKYNNYLANDNVDKPYDKYQDGY